MSRAHRSRTTLPVLDDEAQKLYAKYLIHLTKCADCGYGTHLCGDAQAFWGEFREERDRLRFPSLTLDSEQSR